MDHDLRQLIAKERKSGYLNASAFGGIASFFSALSQQLDEPTLANLAQDYQDASIRQREAILQQIEALIAQIPKDKLNPVLREERPPAGDFLDTSIVHLPGIGVKRAALFKRLGIATVGDLLLFFPRDYEDRRAVKSIAELALGETAQIRGRVVEKEVIRPRPRLVIIKAWIKDEDGSLIQAVWFNQSYLQDKLIRGQELVIRGKLEKRYRDLQFMVQDFEFIGDDWQPGIMPVYRATEALSQKMLLAAVKNAWDRYSEYITEIIPDELRQKQQLLPRKEAIFLRHFPQQTEDAARARCSLAYEELLILQLAVLSNAKEDNLTAIAHRPLADKAAAFAAALPFALTEAQQRVIDEIYRDMEAPKVMARLVQGDVGSGKTIVAAAALYKAVCGGYQGVLMAPTELLAEQHLRNLQPLFASLGQRVALLTGSVKGKKRQDILDKLQAGDIDILIGTHALIQGGVAFAKLGLAVTDEQHRFGVMQRANLSAKGAAPDVLVMTATPIPRSLALTLYGDLNLSVIDQLPPGRKAVATYAVTYDYEERINNFLLKEMAGGGQVFVICPLIEESEKIDLASAGELFERLTKQFPRYRLGMVHGRMKQADKDAVMRDFRNKTLDLLVSTTVIEVGIDIPDATVMLIRDAERFGLAQLHQLRGRVGRGDKQSYCILLHNAKSLIARERMQIMSKTADGFLLAEEDLRLRGPGEFFGQKQHGLPELKVADIFLDGPLLEAARGDALYLIKKGPLPPALQKELNKKFAFIN